MTRLLSPDKIVFVLRQLLFLAATAATGFCVDVYADDVVRAFEAPKIGTEKRRFLFWQEGIPQAVSLRLPKNSVDKIKVRRDPPPEQQDKEKEQWK